jgi:hypothetical protein
MQGMAGERERDKETNFECPVCGNYLSFEIFKIYLLIFGLQNYEFYTTKQI